MGTYPFYLVDAFAAGPLQGNPCAVLFDTEEMSAEIMQAVAQEMNLSETSFVQRSNVADFRARYFTPSAEIPLAGHPTIATTWALIDSGRLSIGIKRTSFTLELQDGPIRIDIDGPAPVRITMEQRSPEFLREYPPEDVLPTFGLEPDAALPGVPIQTVSTGTPQIMIPVRTIDEVRRVRVDWDGLARLKENGDFFSAHVFCLGGATEEGHTFARHFVPPPLPFEDPFTGSGTGNMGAWLWHYGVIREPVIVAEQGHGMNRPGRAFVEVVGDRNSIETVRVGGTAVTIVRGEVTI